MANTSKRGFASMSADEQRRIASMGGIAAHEKGTAHEFTPKEAKQAGRKGGKARARALKGVHAADPDTGVKNKWL